MDVQAAGHVASNLTIARIESARRGAAPSTAPSGPVLRLVAAECRRYVPPTLKAVDAGLSREPSRPATWPYKWPAEADPPAADPPPNRPYMPHRVPPTSLELHRHDSSKFACPAADLIDRLIDVYA